MTRALERAFFPMLRSYLAGLTLSTAGASATFAVAAGVAADSTNIDMLALAASISKTTGAWVVGSGNGGLDTGTIAINTWYHVFEIKRPDTGVVDVCVSLSATAPTTGGNIPAAYTLFRRIGSMKTNGSSQWTLFNQVGDNFYWATPIADVSAAGVSATATLITLTIPPGVNVTANLNALYQNSASGHTLILASPVAGVASASIGGNDSLTSPVAAQYVAGNFLILTNTSAQIYVVSDIGTGNLLYLVTLGWIDRRGRDN